MAWLVTGLGWLAVVSGPDQSGSPLAAASELRNPVVTSLTVAHYRTWQLAVMLWWRSEEEEEDEEVEQVNGY